MRLLKSNRLLSLINSYIVDSPQPLNLSYLWNFGSLLATCLGLQIVTGIILAMHYTPNVELAFISVEHIMRDVNYGWLIRYLHANGASFFFIFVYLHIGRGMYYGSYKSPRILPWSIGVVILVLMMGTRFLGYEIISLTWSFNYDFDSLQSSCLRCSPALKTILNKHNLKPIAIYENIHLDGRKKSANKTLKTFQGIYVVINLVNQKMYIGSSVLGRMGMRMHKHLYAGSGSKVVWRAVQKYGLRNFAFIVLEHTNDMNLLTNLENKYFEECKPVYNILKFSHISLGYKHSPETLKRMHGNKMSLETIEKKRSSRLKNRPRMYHHSYELSLRTGMSFMSSTGQSVKSEIFSSSKRRAAFIGPKVRPSHVRVASKTGYSCFGWKIKNLGKSN